MASGTIYDFCLPVLGDDSIEEEDKTDKLEELIRKEAGLSGKELENAILDILWRYKKESDGKSSTQPVRHTVLKRTSPAPWQASRSGTPVASSPRSGAASPALGHANQPALFRVRSQQGHSSPFTSPRPSPRPAFATPQLSNSPNPSHSELSDRPSTTDLLSDSGNEWFDWNYNDNPMSNASSSYGGDMSHAGDWFQSQMAEMSPYDMLRSVFQGRKSDDEIEAILEANNYDLSAAIVATLDEFGMDQQLGGPAIQQEKTLLIGKNMNPGSRPSTPGGQNSKSTVVCKYWLSTGQCLRADCRYRHDLSSHICKYWLAGHCLAGDSCAFSHDPSNLMNNLSLNQDHGFSNSNPEPPQPNFDSGSFPSLKGHESSLRNAYLSDDLPHTLLARQAQAPEFVPSRPQSRRGGSRHQSPARYNSSNFASDENDAFPSLGAASGARPHKKHHGKRGHGHGHHRDKENGPGSLADVVRMSPSPNPTSSPRRNARARASYVGGNRDLSAAAQAIPAPEHIPWLETGERANHEYLKARQEAIRHGGARNKFLQSAAQAWNRHDVRAAKALSMRGQSENDLMRDAHREAARHLYENRNTGINGHDEVFVDLHGLHPAEAVSYLDVALKKQRATVSLQRDDGEGVNKVAVVYAIVGSGSHSKGGSGPGNGSPSTAAGGSKGDKVGKAVKGFLTDCKYVWREFGVTTADKIDIKGSGAAGGGILGIDSTSVPKVPKPQMPGSCDVPSNAEYNPAAGGNNNVEEAAEENGDYAGRKKQYPALQHGKVRILKAEDADA